MSFIYFWDTSLFTICQIILKYVNILLIFANLFMKLNNFASFFFFSVFISFENMHFIYYCNCLYMIIDEVMKFKFKMMTTFRWNKKMTGFVFAQHGFKHVCYVFQLLVHVLNTLPKCPIEPKIENKVKNEREKAKQTNQTTSTEYDKSVHKLN